MKRMTKLATSFSDVPVNLGQNVAWLNALREQARDHFEQQGLPTKKEEDWKYTSLWGLAQIEWQHIAAVNTLATLDVDAVKQLQDAYHLVFIDGVFSAIHSTVATLPSGITVSPLANVLDHDDVARYFGQQSPIDSAGFNALNTMLVNDGGVLIVDDNVTVDKPIEFVFINTGETEHLATHLHNLVVIGKNSTTEFIETHIALEDTDYFSNQITEVVLAENSALNHYLVQQTSKSAFHISQISGQQAENSEWQTHNIALGGLVARQDIHSQLLGEAAHCVMNGVYLPRGEQHIDTHTRIDHSVPNTTCDELYKGVLDDSSHAVFNGKVIVHQAAQKTNANQQNHNLLLSRQCEIDTKPEMEIYADDVKCAHGSTVGQLNEEHLFFLRSRGLSNMEARNILTYAFVSEVINEIDNAELRTSLSTLVEASMLQGILL